MVHVGLHTASTSIIFYHSLHSGLILHGGNECDCLHAPHCHCLGALEMLSRNLQFPYNTCGVPVIKEKMPSLALSSNRLVHLTLGTLRCNTVCTIFCVLCVLYYVYCVYYILCTECTIFYVLCVLYFVY